MRERLALARQLEDAEGVASSMVGMGMNAQGLGDQERAAASYAEGAELARAGGYLWVLGIATNNLADLALEQGDYAKAATLQEESLGLFRQLGDERKIAEGLVGLGVVASRQGRRHEAAYLLRESLEYAEALVDKEIAIWCLEELAALAGSGGEADRAARLLGAVETLRAETGHEGYPEERRLADQTRSALATELGEKHFAAALQIGREMTFEQTMVFALES
jgi:tetratricopeptide (TPR) repeat protein